MEYQTGRKNNMNLAFIWRDSFDVFFFFFSGADILLYSLPLPFARDWKFLCFLPLPTFAIVCLSFSGHSIHVSFCLRCCIVFFPCWLQGTTDMMRHQQMKAQARHLVGLVILAMTHMRSAGRCGEPFGFRAIFCDKGTPLQMIWSSPGISCDSLPHSKVHRWTRMKYLWLGSWDGWDGLRAGYLRTVWSLADEAARRSSGKLLNIFRTSKTGMTRRGAFVLDLPCHGEKLSGSSNVSEKQWRGNVSSKRLCLRFL